MKWLITLLGVAVLAALGLVFFDQLAILAGWLIEAVVFLLAILVAGIGVWYYRKRQAPPSSPSSSDQNGTSNQADTETDSSQKILDSKTFTIRSLIVIAIIGAIGWVLLFVFSDPLVFESAIRDAETGEIITPANDFDPATFWLMLVVLYAALSYRFWDQVGLNENAALTLFGRPVANVGAGAPYAPLFVIEVNRKTSNVLQQEFPADPENIDRTEQKSGYMLPAGKRPPLRIQFRDSIESEKKARHIFGDDFTIMDHDGKPVDFQWEAPIDGLSKRVTGEVQHVARILISNVALFLRNIGDEDEAFKQIEDEMVAVLYRYYTRMSVGQALANIRWMSLHLHRAVERRVGARGDIKSWGVDVQAAFVKLIHTDHGLNAAISNAAQAPFQKEQVVITSEGEQIKRTNEGRGTANAAKALEREVLLARAGGIKKIAEQLGVEPGDALASEVARVIGEGGNAFILGQDGMKQVAGLATALFERSNSNSNSGQGNPPPPSERGDS